jgi:hypothetical protein
MPETLDLPNGDVVTPDTVFLYNNYPYRFEPLDGEQYAFKLVPLYWGGGDMDVPFPDEAALADQWGDDCRGTMTAEEWDEWLRKARGDERFGNDELDALQRELPVSDRGLVASIRDALGF